MGARNVTATGVGPVNLKAKIEAVLFLTAKPIKAQALARIVNADVQAVRQCILELVHDYEERQGGLEIADEDGYSFQVKDEYAALMDEFLPVEMSAALIRTLSAIAIKQPISQSEIIRIRGAGAYEHIRELVNRDLISKREEQGGRSPLLSITKKFQEYFRLTKEGKDLRTYLKRQVRKANAADAADAAAAAGQLAIPNVVSNPEAENQLNHGIFLETADYMDAANASYDPLAAADDGLGYVMPDAVGVDAPVPVIPPATDFDAPPSETTGSISEFSGAASVSTDSISETIAQSAENSPTEADVVTSAAGESISDAGSDSIVDKSVGASASTRSKSGPIKTLSKLEKAAKSKEPKPVPPSESDEALPATAETSSMEVLTAAPPDTVPAPSGNEVQSAPPAADDAPASSPDTVPGGSSVQGRSATKNEPPIGTGKKRRQVGGDRLQELMNKQKDFEQQLKLGLFHGDEGEIILDFEPSTPPTTPPIEKAI